VVALLPALAFDYIEGMQSPSAELSLSKLFGYLPPKEAVARPSCSRKALRGACTPTKHLRPSAYSGLV